AEVDRAVREDIGLGPVKDSESREAMRERSNLLALREHALGREAAGVGCALAVIGDRRVFVARVGDSREHLFERGPTVGLIGVELDQAAQIVLFDQSRELATLGSLDLASSLPQLRLDVGERQLPVDRRLVRGVNSLFSLGPEEAVLVQLQSHSLGSSTQLDVVLFGAGEVEKRGAELFRGD